MGRDFRELAAEHADTIFTYARYALRHTEDAEDVTQEVLVRLWTHRDAIEPSKTRAWVMQVARHLVIDVARRHRARAGVFAATGEADTRVANVAAGDMPDRDAERGELRGVLERAIAALDEPYRGIVIMRVPAREPLSHAEQ